jgi:hypothetical protein
LDIEAEHVLEGAEFRVGEFKTSADPAIKGTFLGKIARYSDCSAPLNG